MMKSSAQGQLFYQFNLDEVVPADHMLRNIDAVLDLSDLRAQLGRHWTDRSVHRKSANSVTIFA